MSIFVNQTKKQRSSRPHVQFRYIRKLELDTRSRVPRRTQMTDIPCDTVRP